VPPETDLTPTDVRTLFGDGVCGTAPAPGAACTLSSAAQKWLRDANSVLSNPNGGHCFGISVTTLLLWKGQLTASQFGGANTPAIRLIGNQAIQREIASTFVTQVLGVQPALVHGTPTAILKRLITALTPNATETYTIRFFNSKQGKLLEGHAVTPYAVEDRGGGNFAVLIYDNNSPGVTRAMTFDTNNNSWSYALNASLVWHGGAGTIDLAPTSASLGRQPCPFCGFAGRANAHSAGK
jgi:hypothetical protein